jgi:hypothetical protein
MSVSDDILKTLYSLTFNDYPQVLDKREYKLKVVLNSYEHSHIGNTYFSNSLEKIEGMVIALTLFEPRYVIGFARHSYRLELWRDDKHVASPNDLHYGNHVLLSQQPLSAVIKENTISLLENTNKYGIWVKNISEKNKDCILLIFDTMDFLEGLTTICNVYGVDLCDFILCNPIKDDQEHIFDHKLAPLK